MTQWMTGVQYGCLCCEVCFNNKIVRRNSTETPQKFLRKSPERPKKVLRKSSEIPQNVPRKSSESPQKVLKKSLEGHQKVTRKSSESHQVVLKKSLESPQIIHHQKLIIIYQFDCLPLEHGWISQTPLTLKYDHGMWQLYTIIMRLLYSRLFGPAFIQRPSFWDGLRNTQFTLSHHPQVDPADWMDEELILAGTKESFPMIR